MHPKRLPVVDIKELGKARQKLDCRTFRDLDDGGLRGSPVVPLRGRDSEMKPFVMGVYPMSAIICTHPMHWGPVEVVEVLSSRLAYQFGIVAGRSGAEVPVVGVAPCVHGEDDPGSAPAEWRQAVFRPGRNDGIDLADNQRIRLQLAELLAEHLRRRLRDRPLKLAEPHHGTLVKPPDDDGLVLSAHDRHRGLDGTVEIHP